MEKLIYRKAEEKDIKQVANLVTNLLGTCNLDNNHSIMDNNISEIRETIKNYYVCEIKGKIIGACGLSDIIKKDNYDLNLYNIKEILYL